MKIEDIILYLENNKKKSLIADEFVKAGYGQTTGEYLKEKDYHPSQYEHFLNYYGKRLDCYPTFTNLWCPELMLFIAESLGVNREYIEAAEKIVVAYEDEHNLKNSKKGATYLPKKVLLEFKRTLKLSELCSILKEYDDWDIIQEKISKL